MQITKTLKRSAPPPKTLEQIILQLQTVDEQQLIQVIQNLGNWVWPKTDLFHWISVLNRVDSILERIVTKYELPHQKMPLEENDRDLLLSVLNLTKTLWDNATNRNLYNSYEHLHNLLCLVEYEVVYELLRFLVKPAQRIPSQRSLRTNFTNGQSKYQVLAGRWNVGLDVNEILSSNSIQVEMINYQYYRTATDLEIPKDEDKIEMEQDPFDDSKSHLKQDSLVTVPLQPTEPKTEIMFEQFQKVKADYQIEDDRAFELLWKIRLCSFLSDPEKRIKLYCIRMLSLAVLSNLYSEEVATNKIFLFESDLISQVAQNLANNTNLGQDARFCCLTLLDNLAHYRGKLNEVLSVMNASANHGFLMVELNNAIESNTLGISKANVEGSTEFVEGLFSFLTFILGTQVGGNMIISAGIIPLLISSFNNTLETHLKIIAKCCNMLDNILYGFPPALNVFTGANGLQALVTRIQLEIDTCLRIKEKFSDSELNYSSIDPGASVKYRELLARMPLLRAIMKLVLHMMQSSGTADGMRNLIDSSLPKSLLIIFENSKLFGSIGVFGLAVNIMSTFIHNEPTSLSILQENQVISAFLNAANQELPVSAEVISAFPNAFGAICLNAPGLQAFTSANPMSNFLSVLTKEDHLKTLLDNDVPHLVGNSIDEFIRHHPTTKDMVMSAIIEMLEKVINIGETISVDINEGTELSQLCPNGMDIKHEKGESRMSQLIDVSCRFLEGLFQNVSHCKDFLKFNGLQLLIRFFTLKAIPHDFGTSPSSAPLSYIVRVILEVNLQETSNLVAEEVHRLFGNISVFLNHTSDSSYVFPYVDALEPEKISEGSQLFHNLVGLKCYIRLLTDLFCSHALSHSKAINSIIATFTSPMGSKLIEMFGKLGRSCSLESFYFREKIPEHWIADPDNMLDVFNKLSFEEKLSSRNAEYFLHLLLEIPKDILGVFKGILKIICTRKVSDAENRKHIQDIVDDISKLLLKNLENPNLESEGKEITYYNTILAETKGLLCDEKTTPFLNTAQLVSFEKMGGIESLFSILRKYLSFSGDPTKLPKPVEAILSILNTATNHKMLHDSSHTSIMAGRTKEKKSSEYFNPHSFLVHIRGKVLTEILDIWEKEDFVKLPNSCIQLVIQIVTQIMAAEGEVPSEAATIFSTSARIPFLGETLLVRHINPAAIVPDESKIALLVDMGFPRGAAEVALRRCGNNVARAADYLINHPEVVAIAQTTPNTNPATNPAPPNPENSTATPDNVPPIQPVQQNQQSAINIQPAISIDPDLTNHAVSDNPQNATSEIPSEELMLDDTIDRDNEESESDSNAEKEALNKLRDEAKAKIQLRCIEILIHIDSIHIYIIKDLLCLIAKDNMKNIADSVGKKISEVKAKLVQKQDDADLNANLSTYFRLVTLLSSENSFQKDIIYSIDLKVSEYFTLIENCQHQRDWYTPFLLFLESVISLVDEPADSSESNSGNSVREFTRAERETLLIQLIRIINFESTDSDLLHSVLRLLVRLTRNTELSQLFVQSNGISALLKNEKFASFPAHQSLVVMILRHCLESEDVLRAIIEADVSNFLKSPRPRSMELQTFIKATSHLVCRNPELFVEVCSNICELYHYDPNARSHQINIKPTLEAEPKNEVVSKGDSTPKASMMEHIFSEEKLSSVTGKIVSYLTSELLTLKSKSKFNIADVDNMKLHLRRCYLLQCLSELVVCYFDSKVDLICATQKKNIKQTPKSPTKNPFLNYLLNDLMHPENIYLDSSKIEKFRHTHQVTESTWASCLITGLCFHKGKLDENRSAELKSIRTIVLDSIFKSLKDTFNNIDLLPEVRFGKLINLCELCYKILTVKGNNVTLSSNQSASNLSEPTLQIVQLMIEKGFVNLFTNILADLDIHHPISQKVVETVLKPLEVFSKAAITLGKSEVNIGIKGKKVPNTPISSNAFDSVFREIVDESMGEENELSSVYRNSALGMLDPASEEEESDSEEEDSDLFETFSGDEEMEEDSEEDGESSTEDEMEIVVPQPFQGNQDVTSSEDEQGNLESEEEMHIDDGAHWQTEVLTEEEIDEGDSEPEDDEDEENQENIADEEHDHGEDGDDEEDELDGPLDMLGDDPMDDAFVLHPDMVTGNATRRMQELFAREIDMNHGIIDMRGVGSLLRNPLDNSDPPIYIRNLTGSAPNTDMSHPFLVNPQNNTPQNPSRRSNNRAHGLLNDINHSDEGSMISTNLMDQIFARTGFLDSIQHHHLHTHANTATNVEPQKNEPEVLASPLKEQVQHIHSFLLLFTDERWKQEAKVLYGTLANSKATRISTALLERLIPPAMEKIRILEEEKKRIELENKKKEEEEKAQKEKELREQQIESEGEHSQAENNEDVEMESTASAPPTEERVFVTIDGNDIDITGTGIDPTFLEALPDDLRQEVINQHMRELGSQRTGNAPESTEINPEFLNALPYAIRQEVLRQERMENQQRESNPVGAATSTPLRSNIPVPSAGQNSNAATPKTKHVHSKESAQLLDLPGLASLLRLIFVPEPLGNDYLDRLLCNLCENTKTRTELLGLLFSVLVHGSNDLASVDKEFAQLTLKSRSNLPYAAKEKKINSLSDHDISDKIPNLVAQRCLESLTKLVTSSPAVGKYFLTEIENPLSSKTPKSTKKSKGKEKLYHPLNCYPVVLLLNLLEKSSFLQNGVVLEQLMQLLSNVLRPLAHLAKKKFSEPEEKDSMKTPTKDRKEKPDVKLPKIPDNSVRNVVNVLKGAVCSSRTFQHTLAVIQQLCTFPENMKIITKAILESAQSLGNIVVDDLDLLVEKLKVAPTTPGTNVDKAALEPFISATASQAKLLRILKSVDFMFSKNQDKAGSNGKSSDMETLKSHYEELKFAKLWTELGECMDIIENNENLIHVATIILPLIESFMVISTPSVSLSKEKPLTNTVSLPNVLLKQHSEISEIEQDSFFTFAEAHKKILNTMVRNNPSLMNGSFSLLVQNPKVLQFDNKRTYFTQQLHKNSIARVSHGSIQINVRRQYVFEESYQQLQGKSGDAIKYGKLNVRFRDEEGVDAGGVTREWFSALALQMFNPDYALFRPSAADKVTYQPNRTSGINPDHLFYFKFVGRIIGKAIYDGRLLDAYFTRSFYKCIINSPVDHRDMEAIDPEFYKSLDWMLNNDITDVLDLTFSLEVDDFGKQKIIDLKENGRNIPVTEANKTEYVRLVTEQKLVLAIKDQIQAFLNGFHEIIPRDLIKIFNEQELELLISGLPDIDIDDWKNNTEYQNYTSTSPQIQWFWRAVRSFSQEERAKLIQFATGTSKVPLGGFAQLQGSTGIQKFQIHREFSSNTRLPSAHTCFNQIDLPQYDNYEQLRAALLMAISECGTGKDYVAKFQGLGLHNVFNKRYEIISRFLMDINGVDFVADAHDAAVLRIVDMLRHPDDLTSKLPTLRKKIAMERASVEAQLKTVMETQLDSTQKGIDNLERCREETNTIKAALQNMDEICGDSENHIRNYSFIQKISRAHQNFTTTKTLVEKFQKINSQMNRVSKLLDDDSKRVIGHAENLLLIHYNIQQLSIFRSKILSEARGLSSDVLNTLNAMFKKLDQLEYKFEAYFWELAKNSIELVKADFPSTVVRIIKIIEVEEKLDEAISMQDFSEDMTGDAYDQLRGRQIKGYRIKYFDLLRDKINEEMKKTYLENQKELSAVLKSFDSIIDTLMFVHDDIAPLYPARYNIFHFFVLEYHRAIYNMVNTMTEGEIEPAVILILIKWVRDYYSSMALRLDVSEDLLEPRLLDGREDEFMESYVKLVRGKLSEWLKNILKTETVDFLERKNPPEMDTTEQYLFTGSVIVFQMFNQQLDVVAGTSRGQLLSEIVTECCCIMEEFQAAWIKIIDVEYNKFTHKQADLNEGLVEYIMALANDCMRSTEFSDTISARLETMSDEQYKAQNLSNVKIILDGFMKIQKRCLQILVEIVMSDLTPALNVLHCSQWYEQDIMKLIVGTFEDYGDDFQKHMSEYLNNKLTTELVDRFLIAYVESFKNKNAKFKMPSATDRMRQDLDSLITFFSRSKNAKRVKASFEVIEKIIGLIESNPRMLYIDFYSLWKQFPDMPLDFVEKVLSKRDDLDKSQVREIMELCRSKTKDERTEDVPPTIFSKISK